MRTRYPFSGKITQNQANQLKKNVTLYEKEVTNVASQVIHIDYMKMKSQTQQSRSHKPRKMKSDYPAQARREMKIDRY